MIRRVTLLLLVLTGCSQSPAPSSGQARADAATVTACREHADAAYNRRNRDTIYTISSRDTPYSANYTPGVVDRGLPQRFGREEMVRDCVRNTGTETDRSAGSSPTQPIAVKPAAKP